MILQTPTIELHKHLHFLENIDHTDLQLNFVCDTPSITQFLIYKIYYNIKWARVYVAHCDRNVDANTHVRKD